MGRRRAAGPVRTLADMTPEERAKIAATSKPPPKTPIEPYPRGRRDGQDPPEEPPRVEVVCLRMVRETAKAALYELADTGEQRWIPKSLIPDADTMDDGTVLLKVPRWLAEREGLLDE